MRAGRYWASEATGDFEIFRGAGEFSWGAAWRGVGCRAARTAACGVDGATWDQPQKANDNQKRLSAWAKAGTVLQMVSFQLGAVN